MDARTRRQRGSHYTSTERVLEVLDPLLFDGLSAAVAQATPVAAPSLQRRLCGVQVLDPACGDGNFLVGAYEALCALQESLGCAEGPRVHQRQLRGIEASSEALSAARRRLPGAVLVEADALTVDWTELMAPGEDHVIAGNPPFIGKHLRTPAQTSGQERVLPGGRALDYAAAWVVLAARFVAGTASRVGFVLTSSVCQGEQVAPLWRPVLDELGLALHFAHRPFTWSNDPAEAGVSCVIVGFGMPRPQPSLLIDGDGRHEVAAINAYLVAGPPLWVQARSRPLSDVPVIRYGSKPVDGGALLLDPAERAALLAAEPEAARWVRPLVSAREWLRGEARYCLWIEDAAVLTPRVAARVERVRAFRAASKKAATRRAADCPHRFAEIRHQQGPTLVVPMHTTGERDFVPLGWAEPCAIVHNSVTCVPGATSWHLGVLSSSLHGLWLRTVGGRITHGLRYSNRLVYNTFPWPEADAAQQSLVGELALAMLAARTEAPLTAQYDPGRMTPALTAAHAALDAAVDALYRTTPAGRLDTLQRRYREATAHRP